MISFTLYILVSILVISYFSSVLLCLESLTPMKTPGEGAAAVHMDKEEMLIGAFGEI